MPLLEAPAWHQFHADACDRGQSLKAIKPGKFNHPREHEAQHSAHTLLWKKAYPDVLIRLAILAPNPHPDKIRVTDTCLGPAQGFSTA